MGLTQEQCSLFADLWLGMADDTVPLADDAAAISSTLVGRQTGVSAAKALGALPCAQSASRSLVDERPTDRSTSATHSAWVH